MFANVGHTVNPDVTLFNQIDKNLAGLGHFLEVHVKFKAVHVAAKANPLGNNPRLPHALANT